MGNTLRQGVASNSGGINNGLVGYWTFDGNDMTTDGDGARTALDRSGNGNKGALKYLSGNIPPASSIGKLGQALTFNGASTNIRVEQNASINNLMRKTISVWIKTSTTTDAFGAAQTIITKRGYCGNTVTWLLVVDSDGSIAYVQRWDGDIGIWDTSNPIQLGAWHHIAVTYDRSSAANNADIYVDGVKQALTITPPTGAHVDDSIEFLNIGALGDTESSECEYFAGSIDEVRLYNRLLSADEIKRLYNMGR